MEKYLTPFKTWIPALYIQTDIQHTLPGSQHVLSGSKGEKQVAEKKIKEERGWYVYISAEKNEGQGSQCKQHRNVLKSVWLKPCMGCPIIGGGGGSGRGTNLRIWEVTVILSGQTGLTLLHTHTHTDTQIHRHDMQAYSTRVIKVLDDSAASFGISK